MDGLKQRIIGAVVLVCLAVIFIPMLFEQPHEEVREKIIPIPEEPEIPAFTIEAPTEEIAAISDDSDSGTANEDRGDQSVKSLKTVAEMQEEGEQPPKAAEDSSATQSSLAATSETTLDKPASEPAEKQIEQTPVEEEQTPAVANLDVEAIARNKAGWIVQIGTFRNHDSARKIKQELLSSGTMAYTETITSGDVDLLRVSAGPFAEKPMAESKKQELDKKYKVNSLLVKQDPKS